jgi:hypothetical protein
MQIDTTRWRGSALASTRRWWVIAKAAPTAELVLILDSGMPVNDTRAMQNSQRLGCVLACLTNLVTGCSSTSGKDDTDAGAAPNSDRVSDSGSPGDGASASGGDADDGSDGQGSGDDVGPGTCMETVVAHEQCNANSVGLTCTGAAMPDDARYDCFASFQAPAGGDRSVCCRIQPAASSCAPDPSVPCEPGFTGQGCTGTDTPPASAALICHPAGSRDGMTFSCCSPFSSPVCTLDTGSPGCGGSKHLFNCKGVGTGRPEQQDPWLSCGTPIADVGDTSFCCSVRRPPAITCMRDPAIDCNPMVAYSCAGSDTPYDSNPLLVCAAPTTASGKTIYCCRE